MIKGLRIPETGPSAFTSGSFGFSYDALSRRTQMTRPNSVTTDYTYDNLSRLLSVLHKLSGGTIDGATYTVDAVGNRTAKVNQLPSGPTENYTYDAIYQLTQVAQAGPTTTESYSYDPVGNRLSSLAASPWNYNVSNQLTSISGSPAMAFNYDNNGNTLTKTDGSGTSTYSWDYENRLTQVSLPSSGGTVTFKYDSLGRRIYKSSSLGTTVFAYDGASLIEETDSNGNAVARYVIGLNIDEPLAILRSSATNFYQADGLGSVTSLSDSAGSLASTYAYDSFGNLSSSTGSVVNPFRYAAREFDPETGLYFYRARYYSTSAGRFLSEDPIRFSAGPNFFTYVSNRPTNFNDPLGLRPKECYDCQGNPIQGLGTAKKCCSDEPQMDSAAPNPYLPWEGYAGVNAGMMFDYGGDGPWGKLVRSCLLCMYEFGATPNDAHWFCYANARNRTSLLDAGTGFLKAVGAAIFIEAGQIVVALDSRGTNIKAVGPWMQLFMEDK